MKIYCPHATGILFAIAFVVPASAQNLPALNLDKTFPEGFAYVGGIRELATGEVYVADPLGQVLLRLNMDRGTADTLGRVGRGPREYMQPDQVFPLPGDSTLLVDLGNARLTVLGPDGSFGNTVPMTQGDPRGSGFTSILPRFVDGMGKIYFEPSLLVMPGATPGDSAPVLRFDRQSVRIDTVAMVKTQERTSQNSRQGGGFATMIRPIPLSPQDDWAVSVDGSVALIRSSDYHVDWVRPNGQRVSGQPKDFQPVRIRRAEQLEWMEREASNGLNFNWNDNGSRVDITFTRGMARMMGARQANPGRFEWPEVMPPFMARRTHVSPAGEVWVERSVQAGSNTTIDVFDSRGNFSGSLSLPSGRHLVGFGNGTAYLTHTDEYDLVWLERYRVTNSP